LRNNSKSGIERQYKNPKSPENTPKNVKKSTETKTIVPKYKVVGPGFCIWVYRGKRFSRLPPVSCTTDWVHFKHE